jgi:hypothetical protein
MEGYAADVERNMQRCFGWLSEKDRRRSAAVEAAKLGHGGVEDSARGLACDPHTRRHGLRALEEAEDVAAERLRTKGVAARRAPARRRPWQRTSAHCGRSAPPAIRGAPAGCGRTSRGARGRAGCWRWARPPVAVRSGGG